jgi:hypothetical protein
MGKGNLQEKTRSFNAIPENSLIDFLNRLPSGRIAIFEESERIFSTGSLRGGLRYSKNPFGFFSNRSSSCEEERYFNGIARH